MNMFGIEAITYTMGPGKSCNFTVVGGLHPKIF
jgi:hypothetical protein